MTKDFLKKEELTLIKKKDEVIHLRKQQLRFQENITSIRDRIRNIEWSIETDVFLKDDDVETLMKERQSAIDKLRHIRKEAMEIDERLIELSFFNGVADEKK